MSIFGNTGGGLFGGGQNNQPAAGTSLFGSTTAQPTSSGPNPLTAQPTQPSLFGNTGNSNPGNTGGGLFGSTNTNTAGTTGGGLFGGTTTTQPATGLFGNQQAAPASGQSLFGGANTQTGATAPNPLFGGASTTNNATAGNAGGNSIFGGATNTATNPTAGGGTLFGNAPSNTAGTGGLFGNTPAAGTGGGLFGNTAGNTGGAGGLFGNINTNTTGGGLFGTSSNTQPGANNAGTSTGGLFGGAAGSNLFGAPKPAGTNIFGSSTTGGSLFGGQQQQQPQQQQAQQQQQPSLFGSTPGNPLFGVGNRSTLGAPASQPSTLTTSALGASNNLLASRSNTNSQQQPQDAQAQFQKLVQGIEGIYNAWNPQSKDCRFQYNFYNLVDPKQVNLYGRPPNATNDALWEKAIRENPDPSCLVPVMAIGFDDLRARVDAQTTQSASHIQKLNDLQARLTALRNQHSVSNTSRLLRAAAQQTQLTQRLLHLVQHLHLLIPAVRSSALKSEEETLRGSLEEIEEELRRGRVQGRLNELWARIGAIGAGSERNGSGSHPEAEWTVVDEDGLAQIAQILAEQQAGLQHLTKILQKNQKDLAVILGRSGSTEDAYLHEGGGEALWSSTSNMRTSTMR